MIETTMARKPNEDQQRVIEELDRNIILFASAGTGKTFTVARRVSHIIEAGRAAPEEILCLTFTIKAANEMKEDIVEFGGRDGMMVDTRTIHSFAYQIMKEESARNPAQYCIPQVCDDTDEQEELRQILLSMGLSEESSAMNARMGLQAFASAMKLRREELGAYSDDEESDFCKVFNQIREKDAGLYYKIMQFYDPKMKGSKVDRDFEDLMVSKVGTFMYRYNNLLKQSNLLDFDDLICLTHRMLQNEEVRTFWRSRYRYIIIDEMQDTSELEYDMLKQLFAGNHVMMCGDFFQTIYEWRGSRPERVLSEYIREFSAETFMFSRNYRSTRLLTAASFGYLKAVYPDLVGRYCPNEIVVESKEAGEKITNVRMQRYTDEAKWIYQYLKDNLPEDVTRVCIMARSNAYIEKLYTEMVRIGQAYRPEEPLHFFTVDSDSRFFRKAVIKDIMAFFNILLNRTDNVNFARIVRSYVANVGQKTIEDINGLGEIGLSLASFLEDGTYQNGDPYAALMQAAESGNIVIYDTETTGLDLSKDQMIQISAIRLDRAGNIVDMLDQMVIPTVPISAGALATHHQTMEDILSKGGIGAREALIKFQNFVEGSVLVGHNSIRFDGPLVRRQLRECGLPQLSIRAEYDTMIMAKQFFPKSVNYKLGTLCEMFGIVNEDAHNALGDITATGKLLMAILSKNVIPTAGMRAQKTAVYAPKFVKFKTFLDELNEQYLIPGNVEGMTERIITKCGLRGKYKRPTDQQAIDDLLFAVYQSKFANAEEFLREFISDAALSGSQMDLLIRKLRKIPIITVHQSKGCEFDTVIIAGCDDDNFPSYAARMSHMLEEEKRVFYVAISRAKKKLILTSANIREVRGRDFIANESRFIRFIPSQYVENVQQ